MDLVVPLLTRFMSLEIAGKVFIGLTFALLAGAVIALQAALHRRWSPSRMRKKLASGVLASLTDP